MFSYEYWMEKALILARKSYEIGEIPVGCLVVKDDKIIGRGYNLTEGKKVINHAEILAITSANDYLNNWRLEDCDMYLTLDPCPMCASAIKQARIKNVYSALNNTDPNNLKIIEMIFLKDNSNPGVEFLSNLYVNKSKSILNSFFDKQRNNK